MPFPKQTTRVPSAIGNIKVFITSRIATPDFPAGKRIIAEIDILDADGKVITSFNVNLGQHLSANTITQLETFMDNIRSKAVSELL